MPAANVRTFEKSYTFRVQSNSGTYNAIVIPAKKGPIFEPVLVSNENQLVQFFTPNNTIEVGFNMAYYSALAILEKADKLWVVRAVNGAKYGGVEILQNGKVRQVNELSPEKPAISFNAQNIVDGSDKITVSSIQGGTAEDLEGRTIVLKDVGTYVVQSINGSELTLNTPITASVSFVGSGTGEIQQSSDYIGFDVDFGAGGGTNTVNVSNLTSGTPSDLLNTQITLVADDSTVIKRTVIEVNGSTLTLDASIPTVTNQNGIGYKGFPHVTCDVSGIQDGGKTISVSNVNPSFLSLEDLDGKTLIVTANMTDGSTLTVSSTVSNPSGSNLDFDEGFNNPSLIDSTTGEAPFEEAKADGFEDPESLAISNDAIFTIYQSDPGEWSKDIRIEFITKYQKTPGTFTINVYHKNNLVRPLETFVVSRKPGFKDGYGLNAYIEDVLKSSKYIRVKNNPIFDEDVFPEETVTRDSNGNIISRSFYKIVAGDDGDAVTDAEMIRASNLFKNKNSYPLTIFSDGGWTSPNYQRNLSWICEQRDDAMAILSIPFEKEISQETYASDIVHYRLQELNLDSTYAAIFTPHVRITDRYNDREIYVAPDGYATAAINFSKANYEIWFPPAGFKRGRLFVNGVKIKFSDGDLDYLQDNQINPIRYAPGRGIAIWGQRTLATSPSALDRINVRLLLNEIKPAITEFLEEYLFELNTKEVRTVIKVKIEDYLRGIQARDGISSFKVVCDDSNNTEQDMENHVLNVDVWIKPVYSIEFINFTTILSSSGVEFEVK